MFCKLTIIQITSLNQTQKNISFSNRNTSICLSAKRDCLDHIDVRVAFFPHFTQEFHRKKGFGVDRHKLPIPVVARYIRFHPTKNRFWVHLRVEVYGIFKGELVTSKHDKWIVKCYTDVSRVKVNATTPKGFVGSFQVMVPWLQKIWEKICCKKEAVWVW